MSSACCQLSLSLALNSVLVLLLLCPHLSIWHCSEHVLRGHQYRKPGTDMEPEPLNGRGPSGRQSAATDEDSTLEITAVPVMEKFNPLLHGAAMGARELLHSCRRECAADYWSFIFYHITGSHSFVRCMVPM